MGPKASIVAVGLTADDRFPCYGTAHITAYARSCADIVAEADVHLLNASKYWPPEAILGQILALSPRLVGFTAQHFVMRKIGALAHALKVALPEVTIAVGGTEIHSRTREVLANHPAIDLAVEGEGETVFAEIIRHCLGSKDPSGADYAIPGVAFRNDESIVVTPPGPVVPELDDLPSPYLTGVISIHAGGLVHLETYRGCPYHCTYCNEPRGFQSLRSFSMDRIKEEIRFITSRQPAMVKFFDTTFNYDRGRVAEICDFIHSLDTRTSFSAEGILEILDEDTIKILSRGNLRTMEFGLQTVNPTTLKAMGRTMHDREKLERSVELLHRHGTQPCIHIMGALPGDSLDDSRKTLDYVVGLGADPNPFHTKMLSGTSLANAPQEVLAFSCEPFNLLKSVRYSVTDCLDWLIAHNLVKLWTYYNPILHWLCQDLGTGFSSVIWRFRDWLDECRAAHDLVLGNWTSGRAFAFDWAGLERVESPDGDLFTPRVLLRFLDECYPDHAARPDAPLFRTAVEQCYLLAVSRQGPIQGAVGIGDQLRLQLHHRLRAVTFPHNVVARLFHDKRPLSAAEVESLPPMGDHLFVLLALENDRIESAKYMPRRVWELLKEFKEPQSLREFLTRRSAAQERSAADLIRRLVETAAADDWLVVSPADADRRTVDALVDAWRVQ